MMPAPGFSGANISNNSLSHGCPKSGREAGSYALREV